MHTPPDDSQTHADGDLRPGPPPPCAVRRGVARALAAGGVAAAWPGRAPLARTAPAAGAKVLRYAFRVAETGFDPAQVYDLYSATVVANIFESTLTYDFLARPARVVPGTAAGLPAVSADFRVHTVRLRPGIYFQDHPVFGGRPRELVAADYVYSIKRFYDPRFKSPNLYRLESVGVLGMAELREAALKGARFDYDRPVEGLRVLDRYTFEIRLRDPAPRFNFQLADSSFLVAVAREVIEAHDPQALMGVPVGTGPFRLAEWRRSSRIVLERNPAYREDRYDEHPPADDPAAVAVAQRLRGRRLPLIDRVEISIVEENQPRWLAFLNREHDLVDEIPVDLADIVVPGGRLAPNLERAGIGVDRAPRPNVDFALFNMEHPVVGGLGAERVALRRAIGLAYNLDAEIRVVRRSQSIPAQSTIAPLTTGFDPTFRTEASEHSPARAKALLDAYGYVDRDGDGWRERPDGTPLVLEMATQPDALSRALDELWKASLSKIGVRLEFKPAKWPENLKSSRAGKLMMWRVGWTASDPDGEAFLGLAFSPNKGQSNLARFELPAYDALFRRQKELPDGPQRDALFHEAKRLLAAYAPYKVTGHRIDTSVWHPWVIGFRRHPFARDFWKYIDIDAAQQSRALA